MTCLCFSKHKALGTRRPQRLLPKSLNIRTIFHQTAASQLLVNNSLLHTFFEIPKKKQWKRKGKERTRRRNIFHPQWIKETDTTTNHKPLSKDIRTSAIRKGLKSLNPPPDCWSQDMSPAGRSSLALILLVMTGMWEQSLWVCGLDLAQRERKAANISQKRKGLVWATPNLNTGVWEHSLP
jgi:hypothetical protein